MKFGLALPQYSEATSAEGCAAMANAIERLGYDSVWVGDHNVTPPAFADAYDIGFLDAFVLMGYLAAATDTLLIGTTVVVVPYRHPITTANMLATADNLSGGRIVFSAASGWDEEEFTALGVSFEQRGAITDEYLDAIRTLWTDKLASFKGQFVEFSDVVLAPKPVRLEGVPTWIGGNSPAAQRRAVRFGEAWNPSDADRADLEAGVARMANLSAGVGRATPPALAPRLDVRLHLNDRLALKTARPWALTGTPEEVVDWITTNYGGLGVEHLLIDLADPTWEQMVESAQALAEEVLPALGNL